MNYEQFKVIALSQEIRDVGVVLFDQGQYTKALSKFEESLTLNPHDMKARQYRGMCKCVLAARDPEELLEAILDFKIVLYQSETISIKATDLIQKLT